jgi:hypothetical protein
MLGQRKAQRPQREQGDDRHPEVGDAADELRQLTACGQSTFDRFASSVVIRLAGKDLVRPV